LHAKFALADRRLGYLGSANMTRQGFGDHFEIGTRLPDVEADHLVTLLEQMCSTGLLRLCHQ
jgi:phosphatidylserine/phosphatidylglycerophosphate/cardiolipin synthase-like enzyme